MDGIKGILASKTIWVNIIGFLAATPIGAKYLAGLDVSSTVETISSAIVALTPVASSVFRYTATHQIVAGAKAQ